MQPIESRPYLSWIWRKPVAAYSSASSQLTSRHGSVILSRIIGFVMRSLCVAYPHAKRPFTQAWPSFASPFLFGTMRTTWLPFISAFSEQPTPQYAHVVTTECSG